MVDYLSCGSCPIDFKLSDISEFIEHKKWNCSPTELAINILECVKCFRKFNTPWPLLMHIQLDHHLNIVRNLVLPKQQFVPQHTCEKDRYPQSHVTTTSVTHGQNQPTQSIETQTMATCLMRNGKRGCHHQIVAPPCCQKTEPVECCCPSVTTLEGQTDANASTHSGRCPCADESEPPCCEDVVRSRRPSHATSCCQQGPDVTDACCPCPRKSTETKDCQTDFEYFDIDMDFLLSDDGLNMQTIDNIAADASEEDTGGMGHVLPAPSKAIQTPRYSMSNQLQGIPGPIANKPSMRQELEIIELDSNPTEIQSDSCENSLQSLPNQVEGGIRNSSDIPMNYYQASVGDTATSSAWSGQPLLPLIASASEQGTQSLMQQQPVCSMASVYPSENQGGNYSASVPLHSGEMSRSSTSIRRLSKMRKEGRDFRFSCQQCSKPFRQNVHLRKHVMSQHTKLKPHKCPHCGYTTVEKSHLTVHIRTHTGEKPYRCRNCSYSSAQNCTLKSHYLRRHPGSLVSCPICSEGFITEQECVNHQRTCSLTKNL